LALLACCTGARAASIEFTYFEPDRSRSSNAMREKWGESWTWPLKTFPRHQNNSPDLTTSYGLGMIDRAAFAGLRQDKRWIGSLWNDPFNNGRGGNAPTGDDYSHANVSFELAFCFGGWHSGSDDSSYSEIPEWNTQAILGSQVMEIPDRLRPIGGVFVFDSNNASDRAQKREFLTEQPFSDLIAALHDTLGIVTYANPDTEKDIPADVPVVYAPRKLGTDGSGLAGGTPAPRPALAARIGEKIVSVPYTGPAMQVPSNPQFREFIRLVKEACPGGWPISTDGGFVAAAWESSNGVFIVVENPMDAKGAIHVPRTGSVTVRVRGIKAKPPVVDLCGDEADPHRLPDGSVSLNGEFVTFSLNWPRGDARLFWIDAP